MVCLKYWFIYQILLLYTIIIDCNINFFLQNIKSTLLSYLMLNFAQLCHRIFDKSFVKTAWKKLFLNISNSGAYIDSPSKYNLCRLVVSDALGNGRTAEVNGQPRRHYSTVLLTWASTACDSFAKRQGSINAVFAMAQSLSHATHVKSLTRHKVFLAEPAGQRIATVSPRKSDRRRTPFAF